MHRPIRSGTRLARVGVHIVYGLGISTALFPFIAAAQRRWLQQRWSRHLLEMLDLRLELSSPVAADRGSAGRKMIVANHVSWIDVFVISSLVPATFVCKSEVRRWPLIGNLCAGTGTVFLERGNKFAAQRTQLALTEKLRQGDCVALFPEGTTGEGMALLPFRGALLQSAIDAAAPIQPMAIRYLDGRGNPSSAANYCGETSFWQSLCAIAAAPALTASVNILELVASADGSRKDLAERAHALIRTAVERPANRLHGVVEDQERDAAGDLQLAGQGL